jgi:hypothetical protein
MIGPAIGADLYRMGTLLIRAVQQQAANAVDRISPIVIFCSRATAVGFCSGTIAGFAAPSAHFTLVGYPIAFPFHPKFRLCFFRLSD